jgi:hypothetical protein
MVYKCVYTDAALHNSLARFAAALIETAILRRPIKKEYGSEIRPLASPHPKYPLCLGNAWRCHRHAPDQLRRAHGVIAALPVVPLSCSAAKNSHRLVIEHSIDRFGMPPG